MMEAPAVGPDHCPPDPFAALKLGRRPSRGEISPMTANSPPARDGGLPILQLAFGRAVPGVYTDLNTLSCL
jgi:hypothetical protein